MMERLTARQYAKKHKISIYNAIKLARTGQVPSETVEENGKEVLYLLEQAETPQTAAPEPEPKLTPEEEIKMLREENQRLNEELAQCRKKAK